jgi:C-methyltransferase C-terminal domain/Putative zinc binding domain/Methyltransferase domain
MNECRGCRAPSVKTVLALGSQPVSSHFTRTPHAPVIERDLTLGVCTACGLVQLVKPFPFRELVPPYEWITYREPENHLDEVVEKIVALPGVDITAHVLGLTFKDRSTLDRLARRNFTRTRLIDLKEDLGAENPNSNIESVHGLLTPERARELSQRHGPVEVLVVRHILEHAEEAGRFIEALSELLAPGGHIFIEVPDCTANLRRMDYTMVWEEHVFYFTPAALPQLLKAGGFIQIGLDIHPYPFEDVLLLYARKADALSITTSVIPPAVVAGNVAIASAYGSNFDEWTRRYAHLFDQLTADGRKLAAYGAGHLTCAFLSFHGLGDYFAFVVDDTPQKQGLYLPKTGHPIVPRDRLRAEEISACLFGFGPESEDKVMIKNSAYRDAGGQFYSLLVDSPRSVRRMLTRTDDQGIS